MIFGCESVACWAVLADTETQPRSFRMPRSPRALCLPKTSSALLRHTSGMLTLVGHSTPGPRSREAVFLLLRRNQDRDGEASTLESLGYIAHNSGEYDRARDYYQQALALFQNRGRRGQASSAWHQSGQDGRCG